MTQAPKAETTDPVVDRVYIVERGAAVLGFALIVLAAGAVDWRLGAFIAGILLVAVAIDLPGRTRR